jgi:hypothetical protein
MDQRVSAALGQESAAVRTMKAVVDPDLAAMASRRLAVRLMALLSPQLLSNTTPAAPLFRASSPAAKRAVASRTCTTTTVSGCNPHS